MTGTPATRAAQDGSTPQALTAWLNRLAQPDGSQGGGAACGVLLGIAAALMEMVAHYSTEDDRAAACAARLTDRRALALSAAEADGARSAQLGAALRKAQGDPARDRGIHEAALGAAASSAELGAIGIALVAELALLSDIGNRHVLADLVVAGETLVAGIAGAAVNLRADLDLVDAHRHPDLEDADTAQLAEAVRALEGAREAASACTERLSGTSGPR